MIKYFEIYSYICNIEFSNDETNELFSEYKRYCEKWNNEINKENNFYEYLNNKTLDNKELYKLDFNEYKLNMFLKYFNKTDCNEFSENS